MQTDDEPLTLSKWPFYLGDGLLVATALAIAILGDWNLSDWQVASCVIAVALGAGLFVLPFAVEYYMRISEDSDERAAETHQLQKHLHAAQVMLSEYDERLERLESSSGASTQRYEILVSAVDQKLAVLKDFKTEQSADVATLQREFKGLLVHLEALSKDDVLDVLSANIDAFQVRLGQLAESSASVDTRLKALELWQAKAPAAERVDARPASAIRTRRNSDAGLLHRAIKDKSDSASSAVSRIIHSKNQREEASVEELAATAVEPEAVTNLEPELISAASAAQPDPDEAALADALPARVAVEEFDGAIGVSLSAELIEDETLLQIDSVEETPAEPVSEPAEVEGPVTQDAGIVIEEEEVPPVDLFGEVAAPVARRARTKKDAAVLTVSILIGIGNKPFLRGSGGGLSWDKGIPMDFEEIGKWRWNAPVDLDEPVGILVYRNDEDADRKGKHTLEPGQKLEVCPVF
jgi:prefoldin subunit 5